MEYVYAADFGSRVKIGYSTKVPNRIKQIEAAQGEKAKDYYYIPADRDIECAIHEVLSPERISSEWYAIPFIRAKEILVDASRNPEKYKNTHKKGYKGFTEARARANKKYMSQFVEIKVRVTPEKRTAIQEHAQAMKESATTFINKAIDDRIAREAAGSPQEGREGPSGAGVVSLPTEEEQAAQQPPEGKQEKEA